MAAPLPPRDFLRMFTLLQASGREVLRETMERKSRDAEVQTGGQHLVACLDSWLWLWQTHDGPGWARALSEDQCVTLMRDWLHNQVSVSDQVSKIRLPGHSLWALDGQGPLSSSIQEQLKQVVADYRRWLPAGCPLAARPIRNWNCFTCPAWWC